ncbi:HAD family hydrolase [Actinomadura sp. CNU-125]|uniref:HAD family hydrolase n=1 Tax=Actinomadura sp. CNU-125 TaxID=1904961 RepID=UPI0021CD0AE6|nr:HAD family hydrolase [Actinomadura sp. CNU-125]
MTSRSDPVDRRLGMRPVTAAAAATLRAAAATGVRISLLSNTSPGQDRRRALHTAGLADLFGDRVFQSRELGIGKPDAAIYEHVLSILDVGRDQVLCCGNNLANDVYPAVLLGIRAVLLATGPPSGLPARVTVITDITGLVRLLTGTSPTHTVTTGETR